MGIWASPPSRPRAYWLGVEARPNYIAADSGSDDVGPVPLGSDTSTSPLAWQTHDLEVMLIGSRRIGVPMIIGSAGDTGTNSRVDLYVSIIRDLAKKHNLPPFKLGWYYSEVPEGSRRGCHRARRGDHRLGWSSSAIRIRTRRHGPHRRRGRRASLPRTVEAGAEVIIGGRSSDCGVFAPPAIAGYPKHLPITTARSWCRRLRRGPCREGSTLAAITIEAGHRNAPRNAAPSLPSPDTRCTSVRIRSPNTSPAVGWT